MMSDTEEEGGPVVNFPGFTRPAPDATPFLHPVPYTACQHYPASFEVDTSAGVCRCKQCKGVVSPMFVLEKLMHQESRWMAARRTYDDQMQRLSERSRCKCQHCGQMTRIGLR